MKVVKFGVLISFLIFQACKGYEKDTDYRMTKKEKQATNYLSNQAEKITQENIKKRSATEKKDRKRSEKLQQQLNELNSKTSKAKKRQPKKHTGEFKLYS